MAPFFIYAGMNFRRSREQIIAVPRSGHDIRSSHV